ncbi:hypothetical protein SY88_23720 [Clostridiales bacterium PH28_bin88]|nr:hypothetical protein SY88_23720 [Clostridiales bacterium PH28_bin88]
MGEKGGTMAKIKLVGKRERLILGRWVVPGEIVSVPEKMVRAISDRLGKEIEVMNGDDASPTDGETKRSGTGKKRRTRR